MFKTNGFFVRSIALFIVVALSVSIIPTFSMSYDETGENHEKDQIPETLCEESGLYDDVDVLRYIDAEEIERQGFIKRLKEKESLNSYVFLNRDGTESVIVFPENIKYVDSTGKTVEKNTSLVKTDGGFTVAAEDYRVFFPDDISEGMHFEYLNGFITLSPDKASGKLAREGNSVAYGNAFGEHTVLRYTPLLNGIKEDILISQYLGENSFKFNLSLDNLALSQTEEGRLCFINDKGESVLLFDETVAYDSAGHFVKGSLLVEKTTESADYLLTVSIPEEFFTDPSTVYPVTIDPTIYENSDGTAIQDSPIFDGELYQDSNFGLYLADYVGAVSPYGNARTAMRLYGLETNPIYKTLDAEEILSVKISVKGTPSASTAYVNLYRISSSVTWDEYSVTYNNVGSFDTSVNEGAYLYNSLRTEFNITSFAKGWKNLSYTNTMRVIFTTETGSSTMFYSSHSMNNTGTVDNRPYIIFTYRIKNLMEEGTYYIRNRHIDRFLQPTNGSSSANAGLELNAFTGSDTQKWEVISRGNGYYTIKNVYNGYVLSVPSGSYSTYDVQLIQASDTQADGQLWRIYMTSYCGFAIKPKSACGPNDGTGWSDRTMSVAEGNNGNGALVTQRPYVYNNSYKDEWYLMPTEISETVSYEIENSQLGSFIRPEDGVAYVNNALELWEPANNNSQKWNFTATGSGYYKISPYYDSSLAITVVAGSETAENGVIIQYTYSSDNDRQKWFIYKVPHGYALKAKSAGINNLVLSVSEGNLGNGAIVSQRSYVNNLSYKEEWYLVSPDLYAATEGVYYISNGSLYLEASFPRAKNHVNVDVYELCSSTAQVQYKAAQMWRIKRIGNNRYSIRPLYKLDMGLNAFGSNVDLFTIGTSDSEVNIYDHAEWTIEKSGNKYIIKNEGDPNKTLTAEGTINSSNASVSSYSSGNGVQLWDITMVPVQNVPKGVLLYSASSGYIVSNQQKYIAPGEVREIQDLDLMIGVIDKNNISQNGTWSVSPSSTEYINCDSDTGTITGVKHNMTGITVTCSRKISGTMYSDIYYMNVTELANGTYFLKSKDTSRYVDIEDQNMENGENIHQWDFHGGNSQRWIFEHLDDGYYSIKSANSTETNFYLGVLNDGTATDTQVVLRTGSLTDGMRWKVSVTTSGAYKITPKTGEPNDRVLAVGWYPLNANGIDIKQRDYVDDSNYKDEWIICSFDYSILLAIDDTDGEFRHTYFSSTKSNLEQEKCGMVSVVSTSRYSACSVSSMISYLQNNDIFFIHTHGYQTGFKIATSGTTYIQMNDFSGISLSNVKLAVLMTCETGLGFNPSHITNNSPVNIVEKMVICGAETVVGFNAKTKVSDCNMFAPDLTQKLVQNGLSVEDAIDGINYFWYVKNMADIAVIGGNTNLTIR